ncbi:MAG TPA: ribonuclease H [Gemmatimonadales bacterium]|nr:ribonuclease H [Gemmatimonadales bacterium]
MRILVYADEACLGNGQEPPTPGGAGGLIEARDSSGRVERRDYFVAEADSTNNRMALRSAIAALELLSAKGRPQAIRFTSDSSYLVQGMRAWVPAWRARGWRRRGGAVENLELWQELVAAAERHAVTWQWVRGHAGHAKNEYANHLATRAAAGQRQSGGLVPSGFGAWLDAERAKGKYLDYDPDADVP